ncbi:MAG: alginate export family protein [Rubritalea sp.]|uniref:alginate export family protein n=1 Tax=Rubritalea sp. TaxID=2109375 RepID=UPI0032422019
MNNKTLLLPLLGLTSYSLYAGETLPITEEKTEWFKFSIDARTRIEQRNQQGADNSWAGTLRIRPGFFLGKEEGFAAFVETEHTLAFIDDYRVGSPQSAKFSPNKPGNTPIADPENNELNQLYAQYKGHGALARVGRQRLIYDNAAFIGNVGWRQNEQTVDAGLLDYKKEAFQLKYAYANRVNRIFGSDASGAVKALEGDAHLFNGSYNFNEHKFTGYAYLMDFSEQQFARASNNTYGVSLDYSLTGGNLHTEFAYQTEAGKQSEYEDVYAHVFYGNKINSFTYKFGVEYLGEDFVTPLATVHAYNGFADVFIGDRLGLTSDAKGNKWDGLTDIYASVGTQIPGGIALTGFVHGFFDKDVDQFYGFELDLVAAKKISDDLKAVAKYAYFFGDNDTTNKFDDNIAQLSVELNYTF